MSLILEALRKSEAERRRGQTPDLLTETAPLLPTPGVAARDWRVIGIVIGAALVAVLFTIAWLRSSTPPESTATAAGSHVSRELVAASPPAPLRPPQPGPQPPVLAPRTSAAPAPATQPAATTAASRAAPAANVPPSASDVDLASPSPAAAPASPSTPSFSAPTNPPATAAAFTSPEVSLRLSDLSTEERQQLPALKVSMHMWSQDAGTRFAIIDGTRVDEGDRLGDATVEAIQQDAVMLAWRGRHIRLPIR